MKNNQIQGNLKSQIALSKKAFLINQKQNRGLISEKEFPKANCLMQRCHQQFKCKLV
jgi:hypothetical protein